MPMGGAAKSFFLGGGTKLRFRTWMTQGPDICVFSAMSSEFPSISTFFFLYNKFLCYDLLRALSKIG